MRKTALIGINRLRIGSDGHGITTLVGFHGCPLRCRFCLNPQCFSPVNRFREWSPEEVMRVLQKDELYFIASGGGATFGGGEPLLHSSFILDILHQGAKRWHTTVESSLNVPFENIEPLIPFVDEYIVDIKDMNPLIYESYTGKNNDLVKSNLERLVNDGVGNRIVCRIPHIPDFNTSEDQNQSQRELREMGITRIERFNYFNNSKTYDGKREM